MNRSGRPNQRNTPSAICCSHQKTTFSGDYLSEQKWPRFDAGIAIDQLWFTQTGNNLEVSIIGTSDKFSLSNWYLGSQYHTEQFKTSDGKTLLDSQVQNLVDAMAAFSPPAAGQTTLAANYATALSPVIAANWN